MSSSRAFCGLPSVTNVYCREFFFRLMYYKTIIRFGFCDTQNNQALGKSYPNSYLDHDYSGCHKNSSNNCLKSQPTTNKHPQRCRGHVLRSSHGNYSQTVDIKSKAAQISLQNTYRESVVFFREQLTMH